LKLKFSNAWFRAVNGSTIISWIVELLFLISSLLFGGEAERELMDSTLSRSKEE
jgi:hypothetical protein